jgi:hypothetical protein
MIPSEMFFGLLANGAILAVAFLAVAFLLDRFVSAHVARVVLAAVLVVAALIYIGFAVRTGAGTGWVVGEVVGVALYGAVGLRGVRGSAWWLAAGWALHPLWDVALHLLGPGGHVAPVTYTVPCLSFDLLVAAYVAVAYGLGALRPRRSVAARA